MKNLSINARHCMSVFLLLLMLIVIAPLVKAAADTASAVSLGMIDYEDLSIQVNSNNNSVVYYSVDNLNWTEVEGPYASGAYSMDISWLSASSDVTLYFKGDIHTGTIAVTIPLQNTDFKVDYNKADGEFTFENADLSDTFEWRKSTDYTWKSVSLDQSTASYDAFLDTMEVLRVKGAKIIIRLPQEAGNSLDAGSRPSKEATVTIPSRADAPKVSVNAARLTLNTTSAMEYYDDTSDVWMECTKGMTVEEIAPEALYAQGAKDRYIKLRIAATDKAPYSKTMTLKIPGQPAAPLLGGNTEDVSYYYMNSKLVMVFNLASATNQYEYCIVKPEAEFTFAAAKWTIVSLSKPMTLSNTAAPNGCTVYIRRKGKDAGTTSSLILSSAISSFEVNLTGLR